MNVLEQLVLLPGRVRHGGLVLLAVGGGLTAMFVCADILGRHLRGVT